MLKWVIGFIVTAGIAQADAADRVIAAAQAGFDRMPQLVRVDQIAGNCGADGRVNRQVAYCTSANIVFLNNAVGNPQAAYLVAHSLGHAVQVQHGVADIALREITSRRGEEAKLRGYVENQVDCIAGFLMARAGLSQTPIFAMFADDPFPGTHWGRNPLNIGPQVKLGIAPRDEWLRRGYLADTLADCAASEFGAELLLQAYKG